MQSGVSVVTDGNPSKKGVEELLESGVGFARKVDREIQCRPYGGEASGVIPTPPATTPQTSPDPARTGILVYNNINE